MPCPQAQIPVFTIHEELWTESVKFHPDLAIQQHEAPRDYGYLALTISIPAPDGVLVEEWSVGKDVGEARGQAQEPEQGGGSKARSAVE
jgi:hypothetical protein